MKQIYISIFHISENIPMQNKVALRLLDYEDYKIVAKEYFIESLELNDDYYRYEVFSYNSDTKEYTKLDN